MEVHRPDSENWKVTLVETGNDTLTGGRIKRIKSYIKNNRFMPTYGDGVGNIKIDKYLSECFFCTKSYF